MLAEAEKKVLAMTIITMTFSSMPIITIQDLNISWIDTSVASLTLAGSSIETPLAIHVSMTSTIFETLVMPSIKRTITLTMSSIKPITMCDSQVMSNAIPLTLIVKVVLTTPT